jgi:hypothetical protein
MTHLSATPTTTPAAKLTLDLRICGWRQKHGDWMVMLTWLITTGEPCIVIVPASTSYKSEYLVPCVVTLAQAFRWDETHGDPLFIKTTLEDWAPALGFGEHDNKRKNRILGIIRDYLPDLVAMPPAGTEAHQVVADILHRNPLTGKTKHIEVKDHV